VEEEEEELSTCLPTSEEGRGAEERCWVLGWAGMVSSDWSMGVVSRSGNRGHRVGGYGGSCWKLKMFQLLVFISKSGLKH